MKVTLEDVLRWLPDYDNRRAIVARDGLASVDGFRIAVLLTCQSLFGIRICKDCPDCNHRGNIGYMLAKTSSATTPTQGGVLVAAAMVFTYLSSFKNLQAVCMAMHKCILSASISTALFEE